MWWNLQSFAVYEPSRSGMDRYPASRAEYDAKCAAVDAVFLEVKAAVGGLDIVLLAEVTQDALRDLRDRLFPGYDFVSLDTTDAGSFHLGALWNPGLLFEEQAPIIPTDVPSGTRAMMVLDHKYGNGRIRFVACHWTARFGQTQERTQARLANQLSKEAYTFIKDNPNRHHIVIVGDFNEEPFGDISSKWLNSTRSRSRARDRPHHTDDDVHRLRLYDCGWRLLGHTVPHNGVEPVGHESAGTYFHREQKSWHTFDRVFVDGSLLGASPPFLNEMALKVFVGQSAFAGTSAPQKFTWSPDGAVGVSDHLPLVGELIV